MATLKIIAKKMHIELTKGATFKPFLYALNSDNTAVNLTGFKAVMQIRNDYSDAVPLFDLTTENGGLSIVYPATLHLKAGELFNGEALLADLIVTNTSYIRPYISSAKTKDLSQDGLVYGTQIIEPSGDVIPHLIGDIKLLESGVR